MESKFSLESDGAAGRPLSIVAGERLEGCWEQMGAMALFVFVGLFMCFSQLDLRSVFVRNLRCVNSRDFPGSTWADADQPWGQCRQKLQYSHALESAFLGPHRPFLNYLNLTIKPSSS